MNANPQLMTAVEQLGYRVTSGDVATQAGIHLEQARSGLLALANRTGGHLQVTDSGEVIYVFAPNFRQILLRKSVKLQIRAWLDRLWTIGFYLVKISFGILLITSISAVYLTILAITLAALFSNDSGGDCGDGNCVLAIFDWGGNSSSNSNSSIDQNISSLAPIRAKTQRKPLNFLEAVFSVLFGDGNPNADLEQRRWRYIANLIYHQQGVAIGEQILPYLDNIGAEFDRRAFLPENAGNEDYMLPVLTKFNGIPEVSPTGQLVYHFPDLQTTLKDEPGLNNRVPQSLRERKWKFTKATPEQTGWTIGLFALNLVGIIILGLMLRGISSSFISLAMTILAVYGVGLVIIPSCRYLWVKYRDRQVRKRNNLRHQQVNLLHQGGQILEKLDYAKQFAKQYKITDRDIIYTTEDDVLTQEFKRLE
ncbi:hypothetical protein [Chamaesiphon minutus]|uniref:Uncharacterized protein n=1 Tax=Chamaesiphon minutus (strain ATCC 27169 / PCC 6605) TaxID=1173020 RepID=K9UNA2_CHAP6|nr:hypothetical protein [Chamaesiphon minutus]AFY96270.1 hypothetical protein Cha6605_5383 [Chamaesiphon minutus PCC 6605]